MFKMLLERKGWTEQEIGPAPEGFRFTHRPQGEGQPVPVLEYHCWWSVETLASKDPAAYGALCATVPLTDELAVSRQEEDGRQVVVFRGKVSEVGEDGMRLLISAEQPLPEDGGVGRSSIPAAAMG